MIFKHVYQEISCQHYNELISNRLVGHKIVNETYRRTLVFFIADRGSTFLIGTYLFDPCLLITDIIMPLDGHAAVYYITVGPILGYPTDVVHLYMARSYGR